MAFRKQQTNEQYLALKTKLTEVEKCHIASPTPHLLKDLTATCTALNIFMIQNSEHTLKFAKQSTYDFGDKPGRYLANLVRRRAEYHVIVSVTNQ